MKLRLEILLVPFIEDLLLLHGRTRVVTATLGVYFFEHVFASMVVMLTHQPSYLLIDFKRIEVQLSFEKAELRVKRDCNFYCF